MGGLPSSSVMGPLYVAHVSVILMLMKKKVNSMGHKKGHQSKKGLLGEGWFWREGEMIACNKGWRWLKFFLYIYGTIKEKIYSQDCAVTWQVKGLTTKPENWVRSLECMWGGRELAACSSCLLTSTHMYHITCYALDAPTHTFETYCKNNYKSLQNQSPVSWRTPVIPKCGRQRQMDQKSKVSLG